jgi:hypothetical protein
MKYWESLNNFTLTNGQKLLVVIADVVFVLTAAVLFTLSIAVVTNSDNLDTFGRQSAVLAIAFIFSNIVDIIFDRVIVNRLSAMKQYKKVLRLLESDNTDNNAFDDGFIFNRSVKDNIMYGDLRAADEDFRRAVDTALLDIPLLDTPPLYLTASDRQKIILARTLLTNPTDINPDKILSDCDGITKLEIIQNIQINYSEIKIKRGKT